MKPHSSSLCIVPFRAQLAPLFRMINEQWIEDMFRLEEGDRALLGSPEEAVLAPGGRIWFAEHEQLGIVGTCALIKRDPGVFELTKMGVLERARGLGAGRLLLVHALEAAQQLPVETLFLLTSTRCAAAIHLYEAHGFAHDAEIMARYGASYARCDVAMRWVPPAR